MADAKEMSQETAKIFVEAIQKQSELLGSWALAIFGACVLVIVWYAQRRMDASKPIPLRALGSVVGCTILQGVSIGMMYAAYGAVVNFIPVLHFAKIETADEFFAFLTTHGFSQIQILLEAQFFSFFAGVFLLAMFAVVNIRLIRA